MALIQSVRGFTPKIGEHTFLAQTSVIIGDVVIGDHSSVWFNAVVRGDVHEVRIGNHCNVQDGAVIHCTYQKSGTYIGNEVSIGHNAVVHGCTIHDRVLVGMGAIVMDHAVISSEVIIAAGAVVLEGTQLESGYIYGGIPAKKLKELSPANAHFYLTRTAKNYNIYASWFKGSSE